MIDKSISTRDISVNSINNVVRSELKQTLAESAKEIQKLLRQLEETNPSATETQQITYIDIATKPDLKQRTISALKEGGETAIEEFFLENKYLKVGKAIVKGWLQANI
jgi:CHASE3 domain sensor protein